MKSLPWLPAAILALLFIQPGNFFGAAVTPNPGLHYYYTAPEAPVKDVVADVVVYGGTSGGVVSAVQAARMGKSVVLVAFGRHLGGLTSGGLTTTDGVDAAVQGGVTREYFIRVGKNTGFTPSAAEAVFEAMVANPAPYQSGLTLPAIPVYYEQRLVSVQKAGRRIQSITMENGSIFRGKMFIDATYEGDLLAKAGISYTEGREPSSQYGESLAGKIPQKTVSGVNAYVVEGDASSGLIYNLLNEAAGALGSGDPYVQAYNFRMYTRQDANPASHRPLFQPPAYDASQFELIYRYHRGGGDTSMNVGNDINNNEVFGPNGVSTDHTGGNRWPDGHGGSISWSEANYPTRELIYQSHLAWQLGMLWYLKTDPRYRALATDMSLSSTVRANIQALLNKVDQLGFPLTEYPETNGWPHELYVREGRRMVSDFVLTQANCFRTAVVDDSVGLANYNVDSHSVRRFPGTSGQVHFEGGLGTSIPGPWRIAYRALVPRKTECENLLVPWALSASHVAFCSTRMEPCFMVLSQSAATAAGLALDEDVSVQDLDYTRLKQQLLADGQILGNSVAPASGIIVDDADSGNITMTGSWNVSTSTAGYYGADYLHDGNTAQGTKSVRFTPNILQAGSYNVYLRWTEGTNRANNVPVDIIHAAGTATVSVNQQSNGGQWVLLPGSPFTFAAGTAGGVLIQTTGANGFVIADAARFDSISASAGPIVHLYAPAPRAERTGAKPGRFTVVREGDTASALTVKFSVGGTAENGVDYQSIGTSVTIPAGAAGVSLWIKPLSSSSVKGSRTVTLSLTPDTYETSADGSATLTILDSPGNEWISRHFAAADWNNPARSGPAADPNQNGLPNLLERVFALDPLASSEDAQVSTLEFSQADGHAYLAIEYRLSGGATDLSLNLENSPDLASGSWAPINPPVETVSYDPVTSDRIIRRKVDITGQLTSFVRLKVTE